MYETSVKLLSCNAWDAAKHYTDTSTRRQRHQISMKFAFQATNPAVMNHNYPQAQRKIVNVALILSRKRRYLMIMDKADFLLLTTRWYLDLQLLNFYGSAWNKPLRSTMWLIIRPYNLTFVTTHNWIAFVLRKWGHVSQTWPQSRTSTIHSEMTKLQHISSQSQLKHGPDGTTS